MRYQAVAHPQTCPTQPGMSSFKIDGGQASYLRHLMLLKIVQHEDLTIDAVQTTQCRQHGLPQLLSFQ